MNIDWKELLKLVGPIIVELLRIIFKAPVTAARNVKATRADKAKMVEV